MRWSLIFFGKRVDNCLVIVYNEHMNNRSNELHGGNANEKKVFKLNDLDCANCAAKMEAAIQKLDGVKSATISFMTQKLTLEADDTDFDKVLKAAQKCISKVEPDCDYHQVRATLHKHCTVLP